MKIFALFVLTLILDPLYAATTISFNQPATFKDVSFEDWAGAVLEAQVEVKAPLSSEVVGDVNFSYLPKAGVVAVAIKQSAGGDDLLVQGATMDFIDAEGRRILGVTPGEALRLRVPIKFAGQGVSQMDVMVELEPTEYTNWSLPTNKGPVETPGL